MIENIIYTHFKSGGKCIFFRNNKIVHHDDFLNNYWKLKALGFSYAQILQFLSKDPKNEEERQIVKNVCLKRRSDLND